MKWRVQAGWGHGGIQLQWENQGDPWASPAALLVDAYLGEGTDKRYKDQSLQVPEKHLAHVRRKGWALPHSQVGATRGKRLLMRAKHNTSTFPTTWADVCKSQPRAPTPPVNSQMGGVSSQDSRSPKNKADRYTVMYRMSRVKPEDFCLDASICKRGLWYSDPSIKLLREHGAWGQGKLPTSFPCMR